MPDPTHETLAQLAARGIGCQLEPNSPLAGLTLSPGRIVVRGSRLVPELAISGLALYAGTEVAFVRLFSGRLYRIAPGRVVDFADELLAARRVPVAATPRSIPADLLAGFELAEGCQLFAVPARSSGSLSRALAAAPPRRGPSGVVDDMDEDAGRVCPSRAVIRSDGPTDDVKGRAFRWQKPPATGDCPDGQEFRQVRDLSSRSAGDRSPIFAAAARSNPLAVAAEADRFPTFR